MSGLVGFCVHRSSVDEEICVFPRWSCCVIFLRETGTNVSPQVEPQGRRRKSFHPRLPLCARLVRHVGDGLVTHRYYRYPFSQQLLCALAGRRQTLPLGNPVKSEVPFSSLGSFVGKGLNRSCFTSGWQCHLIIGGQNSTV